MSNNIIAVTGATGQQGGATARHLLAEGWQVRALTRDLTKPAAEALAAAGAELVPGDLDNPAQLASAFHGVYGVFSVQNFWLPGVGVEGEIRQGRNVADAAKVTGVQHFVYSSVGGSERNTGVPHFESKWQIEEYVRSLELPATILRPVAFMDNYNWTRPQILNGEFAGFGLLPTTKLQIIAADDIGAFAAIAFAHPKKYIGKALEIAGDELTEMEMAEKFGQVIGRPVQKIQPPSNPDQPMDEDGIRMWQWFNTAGYQADIPVLRKLYPGLLDFSAWLEKSGWRQATP